MNRLLVWQNNLSTYKLKALKDYFLNPALYGSFLCVNTYSGIYKWTVVTHHFSEQLNIFLP